MVKIEHFMLLIAVSAFYVANKVFPAEKVPSQGHRFYWEVPGSDEKFTFYLEAEQPLMIRNPKGVAWTRTTVMLTWERQEELHGSLGDYTLHVFLDDVPADALRNGTAKAMFIYKIPASSESRFHEFPFRYNTYRFPGLWKKIIKWSEPKTM